MLTLVRGARSPVNGRGRVIDYRHFIEALKRKPQAFKGLAFRESLASGELPDIRRLREEFAPRTSQVPQVTVEIPPVSRYDALLPSAQGEHGGAQGEQVEEVTA